MAFNAFQNILPDVNNTIGDAGEVAGSAGPGLSLIHI